MHKLSEQHKISSFTPQSTHLAILPNLCPKHYYELYIYIVYSHALLKSTFSARIGLGGYVGRQILGPS